MVTAAGRKVLQKAIFSFWERIPRRKTGELQIYFKEMDAMQAVLDKVGEHCNIEVQIVLQENGR